MSGLAPAALTVRQRARRGLALLAVVVAGLGIAGCGASSPPARATSPAGAAAASRPAPSALAAGAALAQVEAALDLDGVVIGKAEGMPTVLILLASWCTHCHDALAMLDQLRARRPVRIIGLSHRDHEEYDHRGDRSAVRAMAAARAPWLRVVTIDAALFAALGRPAKVPSLYVYDAEGRPLATFDRSRRAPPTLVELEGALARAAAPR